MKLRYHTLLCYASVLAVLWPALLSAQSPLSKAPTIAVLDFGGDGNFAQAVREEAQAILKREGYRIVIATSGQNQDLSNLQREIDLQFSPYADRGENHPEKGYFRGATWALQGSVSTGDQQQSFSVADAALRTFGVTTDHRKVSVEINLNLVEIRTREQIAHGKGSSVKRYTYNSNSIMATDSYDTARRKAIHDATEQALQQLLRNGPHSAVYSSRRRPVHRD